MLQYNMCFPINIWELTTIDSLGGQICRFNVEFIDKINGDIRTSRFKPVVKVFVYIENEYYHFK